jgi:hypothetical protein
MPEAGGAAIGGDAAVVGREVVLRILGGDPALQRVAVQADRVLRGTGPPGLADARALGDAHLRLDDVDAGDLLGHGVLDLDARIDLDEVESSAVGIHQELDGAGVRVTGGAAELQRRLAERGALRVVQIRGRRPLDHLLVAPLHRAVALEQVDQVAVAVAEELHLDVAGALDQLLQVDLVVAEGGLGLATALADLLLQLLRPRSGACRARRRPSWP